MIGKTVLLICPSPGIARSIACLLDAAMRADLLRMRRVQDAIDLPQLPEFGMILLFADTGSGSKQTDPLLGALIDAGKSVPVILLSLHYDEAQALSAFRMGITDYLGLHEHAPVVASVVRATLAAGRGALGDRAAERITGFARDSRPRLALKGQ